MRTGIYALAALSALIGSGQAALAQTTAETPTAPSTAEDTSRWRYFMVNTQIGMLVSDQVEGRERRTFSTYTVFAQPQNGVEGVLTRFETNCGTDQITDLGGTSFAGGTARGATPSSTNGQAINVEPQTIYEAIHEYACHRRYPPSGGRMIAGRAAAIDYVRSRMARN